MKYRLFFTFIIVWFSSWGLMEAVWWNATQISNLYYVNIGSWRPVPVILAAIVTGLLWFVWNFEIRRSERKNITSQESSIEKKKRERIDSVLRDLSDEDLMRLKKRLMDGTVNDERLEDALMGEDGEIVYGGRG